MKNFRKVLAAVISISVIGMYSISAYADGSGAESTNIGKHEYKKWSHIVNSYLYEYSGKLVRFENINQKLIAEVYSDYDNVSESYEISSELEYFCGFYSGSEYNFVVFGAENSEESDSVEVLRVVKYSKNFQRIASVSIKGANTVTPCEAGSMDMTESQGKLVIHTCHIMYKSSDGYNHQANMSFKIDEETMKLEQSDDSVMYASANYCSHSFNQLADSENSVIYRASHGDAYPRGIMVTSAPVSDINDISSCRTICKFPGEIGNNVTNARLGGLYAFDGGCGVTYTVPVSETDTTQNVYMTFVYDDSSENNVRTVAVTEYTKNDYVTVTNPYVIEYTDGNALVMWEEYGPMSNYIGTQMVTYNKDGELLDSNMDTSLRLSDCKPIYDENDGMIKWYFTDSSSPNFCIVDPDNLHSIAGEMSGDIDRDKKVTSNDALMILQYVVGLADLDYSQIKNAELSGDGEVTSTDALIILQYVVGIIPEL